MTIFNVICGFASFASLALYAYDVLPKYRTWTLGAAMFGIGFLSCDVGTTTADDPNSLASAIEPAFAPVSIGYRSHEQPMRKKYVVTKYRDESEASHEVARSDLSRYLFSVKNETNETLVIKHCGFVVDYANWEYFSKTSDGPLLCADSAPQGYLICNLGDPTPHPSSYVPIEHTDSLDAGASVEIPVWFQTTETDCCRLLNVVGAFFVELPSGDQIYTESIPVALHPDSLDVQYGVVSKKSRPRGKPILTIDES